MRNVTNSTCFLLAIAATFCVAMGCASESGPRNVAERFWNGVSKSDVRAVEELLTSEFNGGIALTEEDGWMVISWAYPYVSPGWMIACGIIYLPEAGPSSSRPVP